MTSLTLTPLRFRLLIAMLVPFARLRGLSFVASGPWPVPGTDRADLASMLMTLRRIPEPTP
jgi:hypothetical protein